MQPTAGAGSPAGPGWTPGWRLPAADSAGAASACGTKQPTQTQTHGCSQPAHPSPEPAIANDHSTHIGDPRKVLVQRQKRTWRQGEGSAHLACCSAACCLECRSAASTSSTTSRYSWKLAGLVLTPCTASTATAPAQSCCFSSSSAWRAAYAVASSGPACAACRPRRMKP